MAGKRKWHTFSDEMQCNKRVWESMAEDDGITSD